jgi:Spy/CpxP family protein refolding chaperone
MLQRKLHLTDDQVDTLKARFAEHREQGRQILWDVLTDEQAERFDRHLERRRGRRRGEHRAEKA